MAKLALLPAKYLFLLPCDVLKLLRAERRHLLLMLLLMLDKVPFLLTGGGQLCLHFVTHVVLGCPHEA